jgi:hypothetical protein
MMQDLNEAAHLSPKDRALDAAVRALMEDKLYFFNVSFTSMNPENDRMGSTNRFKKNRCANVGLLLSRRIFMSRGIMVRNVTLISTNPSPSLPQDLLSQMKKMERKSIAWAY